MNINSQLGPTVDFEHLLPYKQNTIIENIKLTSLKQKKMLIQQYLISWKL